MIDDVAARILREDADGLCTLTLNRPEKLNALDTASFVALDGHLAALEREAASIGCVVLRANGRAFCAGADLTAMATTSVPPTFKPGVIDRLSRLPQPVVVAVHGACLTGGLELALAADFIVADTTAHFADTHGTWGLVAAWGLMQRLSRRIGAAPAKRMMMTARRIDAAAAQTLGLVDMLVPQDEFDGSVAEFARAILANSWHTNVAVKRLMRETDGMATAEALAHERACYPGPAPDYAERLARFARRRS